MILTQDMTGKKVFFPVCGNRTDEGEAEYREIAGYYWCSSVTKIAAAYLFVQNNFTTSAETRRASGLSIRCVKQNEK